MSIVVATAVLVVAIVAIVVLNPFAPSHRATVVVGIQEEPDAPVSVLVDGHLVRSGTIRQVNYEVLTFNVIWKGNATHLCSIQVVYYGTMYTKTEWMTNGTTVNAYFTLS